MSFQPTNIASLLFLGMLVQACTTELPVLTPQDACELAACGESGECGVDSAGNPYCNCDTGFHEEKLVCVENSLSKPCLGVSCNRVGACNVVPVDPPYPLCVCEQGYHNGSETSCIIDTEHNQSCAFTEAVRVPNPTYGLVDETHRPHCVSELTYVPALEAGVVGVLTGRRLPDYAADLLFLTLDVETGALVGGPTVVATGTGVVFFNGSACPQGAVWNGHEFVLAYSASAPAIFEIARFDASAQPVAAPVPLDGQRSLYGLLRDDDQVILARGEETGTFLQLEWMDRNLAPTRISQVARDELRFFGGIELIDYIEQSTVFVYRANVVDPVSEEVIAKEHRLAVVRDDAVVADQLVTTYTAVNVFTFPLALEYSSGRLLLCHQTDVPRCQLFRFDDLSPVDQASAVAPSMELMDERSLIWAGDSFWVGTQGEPLGVPRLLLTPVDLFTGPDLYAAETVEHDDGVVFRNLFVVGDDRYWAAGDFWLSRFAWECTP